MPKTSFPDPAKTPAKHPPAEEPSAGNQPAKKSTVGESIEGKPPREKFTGKPPLTGAPARITQISLQDVYYIYKGKSVDVVALRGFTGTFRPGEITVVMGPSGCGKTTLLNVVAGILTPSSGEVRYGDALVANFSARQLAAIRRSQVGYVFQTRNLLSHLTVAENLRFTLHLNGITGTTATARLQELGNALDLQGFLKHKPHELSGGQRQKAALAVVMAPDPAVLLADEPTGDLDATSRDEVIRLFAQVRARDPARIIVIVTHDPAVLRVADRALFMEDGKPRTTMAGPELDTWLGTADGTDGGLGDGTTASTGPPTTPAGAESLLGFPPGLERPTSAQERVAQLDAVLARVSELESWIHKERNKLRVGALGRLNMPKSSPHEE